MAIAREGPVCCGAVEGPGPKREGGGSLEKEALVAIERRRHAGLEAAYLVAGLRVEDDRRQASARVDAAGVDARRRGVAGGTAAHHMPDLATGCGVEVPGISAAGRQVHS